jgi:hypothetical protein
VRATTAEDFQSIVDGFAVVRPITALVSSLNVYASTS